RHSVRSAARACVVVSQAGRSRPRRAQRTVRQGIVRHGSAPPGGTAVGSRRRAGSATLEPAARILGKAPQEPAMRASAMDVTELAGVAGSYSRLEVGFAAGALEASQQALVLRAETMSDWHELEQALRDQDIP